MFNNIVQIHKSALYYWTEGSDNNKWLTFWVFLCPYWSCTGNEEIFSDKVIVSLTGWTCGSLCIGAVRQCSVVGMNRYRSDMQGQRQLWGRRMQSWALGGRCWFNSVKRGASLMPSWRVHLILLSNIQFLNTVGEHKQPVLCHLLVFYV